MLYHQEGSATPHILCACFCFVVVVFVFVLFSFRLFHHIDPAMVRTSYLVLGLGAKKLREGKYDEDDDKPNSNDALNNNFDEEKSGR